LIVDAALVVEWLIGLDATAKIDPIIGGEALLAPSLIRVQVANAFHNLMARQVVGPAFRNACLRRFQSLPMELDDHAITQWHCLQRVIDLSDRNRLPIYSARYLELAIRRSAPIASFDAPLLQACRRERVETVPV